MPDDSIHHKNLPLTVSEWFPKAKKQTELLHGFEYNLRTRGVTARHEQLVDRLKKRFVDPLSNLGIQEKLIVHSQGPFVVPDLMTAFRPDLSIELRQFSDHPEMIITPIVVVEVLSRTTWFYDRTTKYYCYRDQESVCHILLVDDDNKKIEHSYYIPNSPDGQDWHVETPPVIQLFNGGLVLDVEELLAD